MRFAAADRDPDLIYAFRDVTDYKRNYPVVLVRLSLVNGDALHDLLSSPPKYL